MFFEGGLFPIELCIYTWSPAGGAALGGHGTFWGCGQTTKLKWVTWQASKVASTSDLVPSTSEQAVPRTPAPADGTTTDMPSYHTLAAK